MAWVAGLRIKGRKTSSFWVDFSVMAQTWILRSPKSQDSKANLPTLGAVRRWQNPKEMGPSKRELGHHQVHHQALFTSLSPSPASTPPADQKVWRNQKCAARETASALQHSCSYPREHCLEYANQQWVTGPPLNNQPENKIFHSDLTTLLSLKSISKRLTIQCKNRKWIHLVGSQRKKHKLQIYVFQDSQWDSEFGTH